MNAPHFRLRNAKRSDAATILQLIRGIAEYEKMPDQVQNSKQAILKTGFGKHPFFKTILCEIKIQGQWQAAGFALYFYTYSTFTGKPTLYLEDLFVQPHHRGSGMGKALFLRLVNIAAQKGCGRLEWSVLHWNTPAIDFYIALGAIEMKEWSVYRLDEHAMNRLVQIT